MCMRACVRRCMRVCVCMCMCACVQIFSPRNIHSCESQCLVYLCLCSMQEMLSNALLYGLAASRGIQSGDGFRHNHPGGAIGATPL